MMSFSSTRIVFSKSLFTLRPSRSAIVPYWINQDGTISFVFAVDSKYGDITDLGGGVRKYESALTGAIREFTEESHNILGYLDLNDLSCNLSITDGKMATIFVKCKEDIRHLPDKFKLTKLLGNQCGEIECIVIITEHELSNLTKNYRYRLKNRVLWSRVRRFYSSVDIKEVSSILKLLNQVQ